MTSSLSPTQRHRWNIGAACDREDLDVPGSAGLAASVGFRPPTTGRRFKLPEDLDPSTPWQHRSKGRRGRLRPGIQGRNMRCRVPCRGGRTASNEVLKSLVLPSVANLQYAQIVAHGHRAMIFACCLAGEPWPSTDP